MSGRATNALRNRNFRFLVAGEFVSDLGTEMMPVALAAILIAEQGILQLGLVLMVRGLVSSVLGLFIGVYVDRSRKTRVLIVTNVVQALVAFGYVFAANNLGAALVLALISGVAGAGVGPASGALLPAILPPQQLQSGNAIRGIAGRAAGVAGPALAGVLAAFDADLPFIVNGATFCAAIAALLIIREQRPERADSAPSFRQDLRLGFREVRQRPWILAVIAIGMAQAPLMVAPGFVILPLAAAEQARPELFGLALSSLALGQIAGGFIAHRYRPRYPGLVSFVGVLPYPLALLAVALRTPTVVVLALFVTAGAGFMLFGVYWLTALQEKVPQDKLARVLAIDQVGTFGLEPIGYGVAGAAASAIGPYPILFFAATVGVLTTVVPLAMPGVRSFDDAHDRDLSGAEVTDTD